MGLLCLARAPDLIQTPLGRTLCLGLFIFWLCRLGIQVFGYSPSLWKGKTFETAMHVVFSLLWIFLTGVFGLAALGA